MLIFNRETQIPKIMYDYMMHVSISQDVNLNECLWDNGTTSDGKWGIVQSGSVSYYIYKITMWA